MNLFVSFKYPLALDEQRHFGRPALACHVTPPALSNVLRALEDSVGVAMVKRGRNFEGFTMEGERVLQSARRMLREQEILPQDLQITADSPQGQLLMGCAPMDMPIAARFVGLLPRRYPGIFPMLRSMNLAELDTGLEHMALDSALGYPERMSSTQAQVRVIPQYAEQYFLLRRAARPSPRGLQRGLSITWAQAAPLPWCLLTSEMHNRALVDGHLPGLAPCRVRPSRPTPFSRWR